MVRSSFTPQSVVVWSTPLLGVFLYALSGPVNGAFKPIPTVGRSRTRFVQTLQGLFSLGDLVRILVERIASSGRHIFSKLLVLAPCPFAKLGYRMYKEWQMISKIRSWGAEAPI